MPKDIISKRNVAILFALFAVAITIFVLASKQVSFHDSHEYISIAKELSGNGNVSVYSCHSLLYPFILSIFVKIFPALVTIKIINMLWLILIGLLLWKTLKSSKVLLLWIFCPLVWWISVQVSPLIPAAFFTTAAFLYLRKWEEKKKRSFFAISAIASGLSIAFYTPAIVVIFFMILAYFYDRSLLTTISYLIIAAVGFVPRLILDQALFGIPIYSLIRYFGVNFTYLLGQHVSTATDMLPIKDMPVLIVLSFLMISPLVFRLYKLNLKKTKRLLFFIVPPLLFFLLRGAGTKYFIVLAPMALILLAQVVSKRDLKINAALSVVLVILLTSLFPNAMLDVTFAIFSKDNLDQLYIEDYEQIKKDYKGTDFIATEALGLAALSWEKDDPYLFWLEEYSMVREDKELFRQVSIVSKPVIDQYKILNINFELRRDTGKEIKEGLPIIARKDRELLFDGYKLDRCYKEFCVYTAQS